jgi:serum/glucocorticoid-regulated kinase 2
MEYVSGGELFT